jgi:hypothetical protein
MHIIQASWAANRSGKLAFKLIRTNGSDTNIKRTPIFGTNDLDPYPDILLCLAGIANAGQPPPVQKNGCQPETPCFSKIFQQI